MAGTKRALSLVSALTPEQQAERELEMLVSAASEPLDSKLIKAIFLKLMTMESALMKLVAQPSVNDRANDRLVDYKHVRERLSCSVGATSAIMAKIGVVRIGAGGGSLRVWESDLESYAQDPEHYQQRPRSAVAA